MADDLGDFARDIARASVRAAAQVEQALRKSAFDIERDAKRTVAVDTGNLKNSIGVDFTVDGGNRGLLGGGSQQLVAEIGPTANYARWVEGGTSRVGPRPFLQPAFDRRSDEFSAAVDRILADNGL